MEIQNINKNDVNKNYNEIIFLSSNDINLKCHFCRQNLEGIIYYCEQCKLFFCSNCEKNNGKNHPHCYYKIRNKGQLKEINDYHKIINNKNYNKSNNDGSFNISDKLNKVGEVISKGTNFLGNAMNNFEKFLAFRESLNTSNLLNQSLKYINNKYNNRSNNLNNLNNINCNNQNNQNVNIRLNRQNNIYNEITDLTSLVRKAKMQYNLENFSDKEIEKALLLSEGNIENAITLLLSCRE